MLTTHTFHTGELTLSYAEGSDAGPPLVLLHGINGRWQVHEQVLRALGDRWHVYGCDLRGHGESGRAPEPGAYRIRDYARDITAFIRKGIPGDEPVALIGFSLGAMVALGTAAALPGRIRGLVLVEPPFMLRTHRFRELPIADLLGTVYVATKDGPAFAELAGFCGAMMPDADEAIILAIATQLGKIDPQVTNPDVLDRGLEGVDLETMPGAIQCPVLLVHGEPALGSLLREDDVAWVQRHTGDVEVLAVDGVGHDIPDGIVMAGSRPFLERLEHRGDGPHMATHRDG